MRKPALQICADRLILGVEFQISQNNLPEFLDSGSKCWTLDSEYWILDAGFWTLHSGRWTLDAGLWMLDAGCYTLDAGLWALDTILDCFKTKSEASF